MNDFRSRLKQTTVTSVVTYILFVVAVVFADIMYLQLVLHVVDSGLVILAIAGAFALGGSVLILPRKLKNGDIKPGTHRTVAISVLIVEFFIMAANVVVAFAEKSGDLPDGMVAIYATYIAPITPVIAALGIILIWLADPIDKAKQTQVEVETATKIAELELQGELSQASVRAMEEFMQSAEAKDVMKYAARQRGLSLLHNVLSMSGVNADQLSPPPTINLAAPVVPSPIPPTQPTKRYSLDDLLSQAGVSRATAHEHLGRLSSDRAYERVKSRLPNDMSFENFAALHRELQQPVMNGHSDPKNA